MRVYSVVMNGKQNDDDPDDIFYGTIEGSEEANQRL